MRERFFIAVMAFFAFALSASASNAACHAGDDVTDRFYVARVLRATHLLFEKNNAATTFVFQFDKNDSVKIDCEECMPWLQNVAGRGKLLMELKGNAGNTTITADLLGKWLPLPINGGKFALTIGRDGFGERLLIIGALSIMRKMNIIDGAVAGKAISLAQIRDLHLPKVDAGFGAAVTTLYFSFKDEDSYRLAVVDPIGGQRVVTSVFKTGEEFAKQPCTLSSLAALPSDGKGHGVYGFEFAEAASVKGSNSYHISIDRIPLNSTGESIPQDK